VSLLTILCLVFGGALAVEGLAWAIAPDRMRSAYDELMSMLDPKSLATIGLLSAAMGLLMIWIGIRLHS
jgi:uncharacterized protein YjeT (DUF2065 family)